MGKVIDISVATPDKVKQIQALMGAFGDVLEDAAELTLEEKLTALMVVTAKIAAMANVPRKRFVALMKTFLFQARVG